MADTTLYYRTAEGALVSRTVTGEGEPVVPDGATVLTPEEHAAELVDIEAQREAHAQELTDADAAAALEDYSALRAAGIPEVSARRLTGYTGPDVEV